MKYFLPLVCLFFFLDIQAQERTPVDGLVKHGEFPLQNVHVRNISSGKFSISGENGKFQLNLKVGDTLLLTHVGMEDLIAFIKQEDLKNQLLEFSMTESSMELSEVVVNEDEEISTVSVGIIPRKVEKLSVNERRLRTAGDFKPKHLLGIIGGGVSIDAILNAINGRTKKLKRNVEIEKKQQNIVFLEVHFSEYMREEMGLSEREVNLLINEVIENEEFQRVKDTNNEAQMQFFLQDQWIKFEEKLKDFQQPK